MTKTEIINQIAKEHLVERVINKIADKQDGNLDDLCNDIYVSLLEKDDKKIVDMYNNSTLPFFTLRMVKNNLLSANSPYYRTYKKPTQNNVPLTDEYNTIVD